VRASEKFKKERSVAGLFKAGLVAYQAVISSDSSYRKISNLEDTRDKYHLFFKSNAAFLGKLSAKRKKILSYFYSHEISMDSIIEGSYRPHTHIIFFLKKEGYRDEDREALIRAIEEEFNESYPDRSIDVLKSGDSSSVRYHTCTSFKDISRSFEYLYRAYSLSEQYMREIRNSNIRTLNKSTVECYHNLIFFLSGGIRRNQYSHIPSVKEEANYKHPLLQKKLKQRKIKKEKNFIEKPEEHESSLSRKKSRPSAPGRRRHVSRASGCSEHGQDSSRGCSEVSIVSFSSGEDLVQCRHEDKQTSSNNPSCSSCHKDNSLDKACSSLNPSTSSQTSYAKPKKSLQSARLQRSSSSQRIQKRSNGSRAARRFHTGHSSGAVKVSRQRNGRRRQQ
jgi:hypothetical protein